MNFVKTLMDRFGERGFIPGKLTFKLYQRYHSVFRLGDGGLYHGEGNLYISPVHGFRIVEVRTLRKLSGIKVLFIVKEAR